MAAVRAAVAGLNMKKLPTRVVTVRRGADSLYEAQLIDTAGCKDAATPADRQISVIPALDRESELSPLEVRERIENWFPTTTPEHILVFENLPGDGNQQRWLLVEPFRLGVPRVMNGATVENAYRELITSVAS